MTFENCYVIQPPDSMILIDRSLFHMKSTTFNNIESVISYHIIDVFRTNDVYIKDVIAETFNTNLF